MSIDMTPEERKQERDELLAKETRLGPWDDISDIPDLRDRITALESALREVGKIALILKDAMMSGPLSIHGEVSTYYPVITSDTLTHVRRLEALAASYSEPLETYIDTDLPMPPKTVREVEGKIVSEPQEEA